MAVTAATTLRRPRARALTRSWATVTLGLGLLAALSVIVRTVRFDVGYWIDEGLSVGIADRPLADIPGVLRQDGSPPAYYLLLGVWIRLVGDTGEQATHALSLLLATLTIPVAWALGRALFGARAGWIAAALYALNPFLTQYAQETRMYALVVALATVSVSCFVAAFALRRGRGWLAGFVAAHAALLYTHNWALFLGAGLALAWVLLARLAEGPERRAVVRDGLLAAAALAVLYAPWVPTMLYQAAHTGAPWANPPGVDQLLEAPGRLVGVLGQYVLLVAAGAGVATLLRGRARAWGPEGRAAAALAVTAVAALVIPWTVSQASPTWAGRYLAVLVAPLVLLSVLGLARAGRVGTFATVVVAALWIGNNGPAQKSNVREAVTTIAPSLQAGDLVVSTQPEQAPVVQHYLSEQGVTGLRWATLWGPLTDLGVTDWRDGVERLEATDPQEDLAPLLDAVGPGERVVLVMPDVSNPARWRAPWTALVRRRSAAWEDWVRRDGRFRVVDEQPPQGSEPPNSVRSLILAREPVG